MTDDREWTLREMHGIPFVPPIQVVPSVWRDRALKAETALEEIELHLGADGRLGCDTAREAVARDEIREWRE